MIEAVYRYPRQSDLDLPVRVRSAGCYRVWSGWSDWIKTKDFLELFWCISGEVKFGQKNGDIFTLQEGFACCYFPGDRHHVFADKQAEFCWVTFDGDKYGQLIENFALKRKPWIAGNCPQELFSNLRMQLRKPGKASEISAGILGYELLCRAKIPANEEHSTLAERFCAKVEECCDDPELSVDSIAEELGVHRSTLMRNVYAVCRQTPREYLVSYRMNKALGLLLNPELSIKEIAEQTGFASPNYFGKVFLNTFGKTPSDMRNG